MKSQGLPLQTIVILVLVIVALAAILMFFFGGFGKSGGSLNDQQALATCQSRCSRAKAIASELIFGNSTDKAKRGILYTSTSSVGLNIYKAGSYSNYCTKVNVEGSNEFCSSLMSCNVLFKDETDQCRLGCADDTATNPPGVQVKCS